MRFHLPESNVRAAEALLLHVTLEATTTAEYSFAQSTLNEQFVMLVRQETVCPWVPVNVAV